MSNHTEKNSSNHRTGGLSPGQIIVSIIISAFGGSDALADSVESLSAVKEIPLEVRIREESSSDTPPSFLSSRKDHRVHYERCTESSDGNRAAVENELASRSKGEVLYFLNDDAKVDPRKLTALCETLLRSGKGVAMAACNTNGKAASAHPGHRDRALREILSGRMKIHPFKRQLLSRLMFKMPPECCSACVVKAEVFNALGGFNTQMPMFADVDFYLRAVRRFGIVWFKESILIDPPKPPTPDPATKALSQRMMLRSYANSYGLAEIVFLKTLFELGVY